MQRFTCLISSLAWSEAVQANSCAVSLLIPNSTPHPPPGWLEVPVAEVPVAVVPGISLVLLPPHQPPSQSGNRQWPLKYVFCIYLISKYINMKWDLVYFKLVFRWNSNVQWDNSLNISKVFFQPRKCMYFQFFSNRSFRTSRKLTILPSMLSWTRQRNSYSLQYLHAQEAEDYIYIWLQYK